MSPDLNIEIKYIFDERKVIIDWTYSVGRNMRLVALTGSRRKFFKVSDTKLQIMDVLTGFSSFISYSQEKHLFIVESFEPILHLELSKDDLDYYFIFKETMFTDK